MELRQYLEILKRHKWLIVQATVLVAVAAFVFSDLKTPMYESTAQLLLRPNDAAEQLNPTRSVDVSNDPDRYVTGQLNIIQSEDVAKLAAKSMRAPDNDPVVLLREVSAAQGGTSDVVNIKGHSTDPIAARNIANAFAKAYIEDRRQYEVAGLQKAVDQIDQQLTDLQGRIAQYDKQIGDGGLTLDGKTTVPQVIAPNAPQTQQVSGPTGTGLDNGAQPTDNETLKAARYAAATQYETLFSRKNELQVDISLKRGEAELVAEASTPGAPVSPKPKRDAALGAFLGLLLGAGIAFLREQLDDRIRSREDAERATGLPLLAELPLDEGLETQPAVSTIAAPHSSLSEAVRGLRTSLAFLAVDQPIKRIVVTSPGPGDGKSMVAANLAAAYAQAGHTVVLVSGDLRRPSLERLFEIDRGKTGLSDVLAGTKNATLIHATANGNGAGRSGSGSRPADAPPVGASLVPVGEGDLYLLPAGSSPPNPAELLGSNRMAQLLDELDLIADIVIIDTPPLLAVTDAATLAPRVDAVVLVTALNETHRGAAKRAKDLISNADVSFFGLVLNKVGAGASGSYQYYDYYGERPAQARKRFRRNKNKDVVGASK